MIKNSTKIILLITILCILAFLVINYIINDTYYSHFRDYSSKETIYTFNGGNYFIGKTGTKVDLCNKENQCLNYVKSFKENGNYLYVYMSYREHGKNCNLGKYCFNLFGFNNENIEGTKAYPSPQYLKINLMSNEKNIFQEYNEMNNNDKTIFEELEKIPSFYINGLRYTNTQKKEF